MMDRNNTQLVLLPGLGADHRLLQPQQKAFPALSVPPWIPPRRRETLSEYAKRLAETIQPARPLVLGGVSLGGMVAYEMARHLRPEAVVLIASCRSGRSVRAVFRGWRPLLSRIPAWCVGCAKLLSPLGAGILGGGGPEFKRLCVTMFRDADSRFISWAAGAILHWRPEPVDGIPVSQIHGGRDRLIPASLVQADEILPDGGHLINLTHAEDVNRLLRQVLGHVAVVREKG